MKIIINGEAVEFPIVGGGGSGGGGVPKGTIVIWSGGAEDIPTGWALCDGQDGRPDLRGRFVLGGGGTHAVGSTGGEEEHTLTVEEMPEHSHTYEVSRQEGSSSPLNVKEAGPLLTNTAASNTGGSQPHNNMPPYYALCYIQYIGDNPAPTAKIYGVSWDGSETTKLTRTDAAVDFSDPTPAVGNVSGSSPFDNIAPWSGMVRVTQDGNELVAIPKYWVKVSHAPFKVQIADKATPGYQVSPAHRDRGDGKGERDVVYIGRYECDGSYMSRSGQAPKVSTPLSTFRSGIHGLGAEYWQADFALQLTWWFLYIVEFADWNGQTAIGQGNVSTSAAINTGATDSMTYHTGRAAGTDGKTAVQYRWIENPWGNVREWRDGIIFSDANISTYNNPANFSDSYNGTGATVRSNKRADKGGLIKAWGYDSSDASFIYPSEVGGSETTFVPDYLYYGAGVRGLFVGGPWDASTTAGPFCLSGDYTPTGTRANIGSRLQKLPNTT